jgi:aminomethyltransferase
MSDPDFPPLRTPLFDAHVALGARMVPFGGWEMPLQYEGQLAEHEAVRRRVGLFDVSHMGQVRLTGARVWEFLALLVPGNTGRLADGDSLYTTLCNEQGGVVDDLIVSRLGPAEAFAVINAATTDGDLAWMLDKRDELGFEDVGLFDEREDWAMLAVQGPEALGLLERLVPGTRWSGTKPFTLHVREVDGALLLVSRTGYTGEDGVELLCPPDRAAAWWNRLIEAGAVPCGLAARDSLRLEMGYPLYGQDLDTETSPLEGGIGWTVCFRKPEAFIGRAALERQKAEGAPRVRVGLRFDGRRPMRHGDVVSDGERPIGRVTSGGFSPTAGVGIGLALVERRAAQGKATLFVDKGGRPVEAAVVKPPFVVPGSARRQ